MLVPVESVLRLSGYTGGARVVRDVDVRRTSRENWGTLYPRSLHRARPNAREPG